MSDLDQKRDFVEGLYPGPRWKAKVRTMPDGQVLAIYMRESNKAKDKPKKPSEPEKKESDSNGDIPF